MLLSDLRKIIDIKKILKIRNDKTFNKISGYSKELSKFSK